MKTFSITATVEITRLKIKNEGHIAANFDCEFTLRTGDGITRFRLTECILLTTSHGYEVRTPEQEKPHRDPTTPQLTYDADSGLTDLLTEVATAEYERRQTEILGRR